MVGSIKNVKYVILAKNPRSRDDQYSVKYIFSVSYFLRPYISAFALNTNVTLLDLWFPFFTNK